MTVKNSFGHKTFYHDRINLAKQVDLSFGNSSFLFRLPFLSLHFFNIVFFTSISFSMYSFDRSVFGHIFHSCPNTLNVIGYPWLRWQLSFIMTLISLFLLQLKLSRLSLSSSVFLSLVLGVDRWFSVYKSPFTHGFFSISRTFFPIHEDNLRLQD